MSINSSKYFEMYSRLKIGNTGSIRYTVPIRAIRVGTWKLSISTTIFILKIFIDNTYYV